MSFEGASKLDRLASERAGRFLSDRPIPSLDATEAAAAIAKAADVALVIDGTATIVDAAVSASNLESLDARRWIGQKFADVVTPESRAKVEVLLDEDLSGLRRWRQVNHSVGGSSDVPVEYAVIHVANDGGRVLAGRELTGLWTLQQRLILAQQSMEREYARVRRAEARYRILFEVMTEAVLIVEASSERVVEANAAAAELFAAKPSRLTSSPLASLFDPAALTTLQRVLAEVRATGQAASAQIHTVDGQLITLATALFNQGTKSYFLVRANAASATDPAGTTTNEINDVFERLPEPFILCDAEGRVISANQAFLELSQVASLERAQGRHLSNWLGRSDVDVSVLLNALGATDTVQGFATVVNGTHGATENVELTAVAVRRPNGQAIFGITMRVVRPDLALAAASLERSVERLTELVGRMPLKDIVGDATDMIERMCIEAALRLTDNNRASAAEILGVSRQSLYNKMRRFEMTAPGLDIGD